MTQISENGSAQDVKSAEPPAQVDDIFVNFPKNVETVNGRWAMLGLIALFGAYINTGQIIPGIF